jgi:hypothetical protein
MQCGDLYRWLVRTRLGRVVSGAVLRAEARLRVAELDFQSADRCQWLALQRMVQRARRTRFGHEHDFARIRGIKDFQRLVPLGTPQLLWSSYWQPASPDFASALWPEANTQLASLHCGPSEPAIRVPVSASLCRSHWKAIHSALSLAMAARRPVSMLPGRFLFLGPDAFLSPIPGERINQLDATLLNGAPAILAPHIRTAGIDTVESLLAPRARRVEALPLRCLHEPFSFIIAERQRLQRLLGLIRSHTGKQRLRDIWPRLSIVIVMERTTTVPANNSLGMDCEGVAVHPACLPLEAPMAVEDPRHGRLRLLADAGVFHEFIPQGELERPNPTRHTLVEVEPGEVYSVAFTAPSGLWACLTDLQVCFEKRDPWLIRFVRQQPAIRRLLPAEAEHFMPIPAPGQARHPRTAGSAARRPGSSSRSALSAHADRE